MPEGHEIGLGTSALLRSTVVWESHGCMPLRADDSFLPQLERYRKAGVTVASLNVGFAEVPLIERLRVLSFMRQWIAHRPDRYRLIATVDDIHVCKREGKLGVVFDVEGMCPVEDSLSFVQTFYELGVRWMLIARTRASRHATRGGRLLTGFTSRTCTLVHSAESDSAVVASPHLWISQFRRAFSDGLGGSGAPGGGIPGG